MANGKSYKARALVLRKTKLADKDLIVTMLAESGEKLQAVAKGARKPGGSLAARLELFEACDLMLARGRSLDVITEARLSGNGSGRHFDLEQAACASALAELVGTVAQESLEQPRLFAMTDAAFEAISAATPDTALVITAADLLKTLSLVGYRPSFDTCVNCGSPIEREEGSPDIPLSISEGGVFCRTCARPSDSIFVEARIIGWASALIATRFSEIDSLHCDVATAFDLLQLARRWAHFHTGRDIKSLDFLFTSGLY